MTKLPHTSLSTLAHSSRPENKSHNLYLSDFVRGPYHINDHEQMCVVWIPPGELSHTAGDHNVSITENSKRLRLSIFKSMYYSVWLGFDFETEARIF